MTGGSCASLRMSVVVGPTRSNPVFPKSAGRPCPCDSPFFLLGLVVQLRPSAADSIGLAGWVPADPGLLSATRALRVTTVRLRPVPRCCASPHVSPGRRAAWSTGRAGERAPERRGARPRFRVGRLKPGRIVVFVLVIMALPPIGFLRFVDLPFHLAEHLLLKGSEAAVEI